MRRVRLIASSPYLSAWMNMHPHKNKPDAPLWISVGTTNHGGRLRYNSLVKLAKTAVKRAGITKKVNLYRFRKSRATHLAKHLTESQLCTYFGWVLGSRSPQVYVHLSGRDTDQSLLEIYGMKKKEERKEDPMKPKTCSVCSHVNEVTASFCNKCGKPLELKTMLEMEEKKAIDEGHVVKMLETPSVIEDLVEKVLEKRLEKMLELHPNLSRKLVPIAVGNEKRG